MSNLQQIAATNVLTSGTLSGATELATVELSGIQVPQGNALVLILGAINLTPPGSTSSVRLRIKQGIGTGGTAVGDTGLATNGPAASAIGFASVMATDALGNVANASYTLTVVCTAGSGAGTVNTGALAVFLFT